MSVEQDFAGLRAALASTPSVTPAELGDLGRAVFVGSGDSLASALHASPHGHRAMSSGDIAWMDQAPAGCDTVVGISHSGTSGGTVKALRIARRAGLKTVAITSWAESPLAQAADVVQPVASLRYPEVVPVAGHLMLAQGVAAVCGVDTTAVNRQLLDNLDVIEALVEASAGELPTTLPQGISILSLPDLRSAADFATLKFIEATGLTVRNVPLEESGHVDYFIGPQSHLTLLLQADAAAFRFERLAQALEATGQTVHTVIWPGAANTPEDFLVRDLAMAVHNTWLAYRASKLWARPWFRGGQVNMDASHIKLPEHVLQA
ncbi:SIS domain-containing protein [Tessaracoccus lapidicaptus]|uniref:SIS domain-containing protein n=1 Tax=Tessaracoccus lapidicaptus TaxID=1427523 RepID=UPI00333FAB10